MTAKQLTDSILQLAIQGKLVPQNPNDEPASVLLERIREEKRRLVKEKKLNKKELIETTVEEGDAPFPIPESWVWTTVSNIFTINPKVIAEDNDDAAFIPMDKIEAGYSGKYSYEVKKWRQIKSSYTCFEDGDVAFAKITPCFQNRKSVIFDKLPNGIGAGTTELKVLRQYGNTIDRKYLLYFLKSLYFIKEATFKGTANQQRIIVGYLENKLFPLPPLAEQHRIVEKIEEYLPIIKEYGEAYEEASKMDAELPDKLKKSILQEAIMGKLGTQDPNDEPASVLLEQIREEKKKLVKEGVLKKKDLIETPVEEDEEPFKIAESWEWCRMNDLFTISSGLSYKKDDLIVQSSNMIRVLRGGNISFGNWETKPDDVFIAEQFVPNELLLKRDTFITPAVSSLEHMGKTALIREDQENIVVGGFILMLRPISPKQVLQEYLNYVFQSYYYRKLCQSLTNKSGQAFYNLSRTKLLNSIIPIPPLDEQERIVEKVQTLFAEIDNMTINNDNDETETEETDNE